jgi:mannose-6-phosphate isomerase-like protein (cupin superfamily)
MIDVYSKVNKEQLLATCFRIKEEPLIGGRRPLTGPDELLQVAALHETNARTFPEHRHLDKQVVAYTPTQEAWVVIAGEAIAYIYDFDNELIEGVKLRPGDCMVFVAGGHGFDVKPDTLWFEFKSGPYLGREKDKVLLNDPNVPTDDNAG